MLETGHSNSWTITVCIKRQRFRDQALSLESGLLQIQALQQNLQAPKTIAEYQTNAIVRQYDRQGFVVRSYKFVGIHQLSPQST